MTIRAVELFCGVGVAACGLVQAGVELVAAVDIDARYVRAFNDQSPDLLPPVATVGDVGDYTPPACDLLCAGPVCKAFSPASVVCGTDGRVDDRNTFPQFFNALDRCDPAPEYVLVENTSGLERFGNYKQEIIDALSARGYKVDCQLIDCYDFGIPQRRWRIVFLCSRDGNWKVPDYVGRANRRDGPRIIKDVMYPPPYHDRWPLYTPLTERARAAYTRSKTRQAKHPSMSTYMPSTTVLANWRRSAPYGVLRLHSGELHTCGPRLAARLQTLPDEYRFDALSKSAALEGIGNGFPTAVVRDLVGRITGV